MAKLSFYPYEHREEWKNRKSDPKVKKFFEELVESYETWEASALIEEVEQSKNSYIEPDGF